MIIYWEVRQFQSWHHRELRWNQGNTKLCLSSLSALSLAQILSSGSFQSIILLKGSINQRKLGSICLYRLTQIDPDIRAPKTTAKWTIWKTDQLSRLNCYLSGRPRNYYCQAALDYAIKKWPNLWCVDWETVLQTLYWHNKKTLLCAVKVGCELYSTSSPVVLIRKPMPLSGSIITFPLQSKGLIHSYHFCLSGFQSSWGPRGEMSLATSTPGVTREHTSHYS